MGGRELFDELPMVNTSRMWPAMLGGMGVAAISARAGSQSVLVAYDTCVLE